MDRSKWEYKKLTDVCSILYGYPFDSKCFNETNQGRPLIRIRDVVRGYTETYTTEDCPGDYIINEGDYLVGMDGEFNISAWKSAPALLNQRVCKISADGANLIDGFMYYLMKTKLKEIEGETAFVTVKHLSAKVLNKVNVHLPSISDQQRIVAELDCLNEMIAVKQEQLKEFDKLAQSIFYDMFGRGMSQKQWEHTTIGSLSEEIKYGTSSPATPNGKYKYLRMNNMTNDGYLDLSDLKYIDVDANDYEKYVVRRGDILFNRTNSRELVGKTALFNFDEEMIIAGYIIRVRLKSIADPYYVVRYMNLPEQKEYLRGLCRGAIGQANINAKELQAIPIPLPPLSLQQQFADKISAIEAQKEMVKQSIAETQHLLDYTMDKYFG